MDASADETNKLLVVKDLKTYFYTYEGVVEALEGRGKTVVGK